MVLNAKRGTEAPRQCLSWVRSAGRGSRETKSGLPVTADLISPLSYFSLGHMRKWYRSRNGIVRPANGATKPCMRENSLQWRSAAHSWHAADGSALPPLL